jgi:hypothetical protein
MINNFLQNVSRWDFYVIFIVAVFVFLTVIDKLPAVESIRRFISTLDDRGGNIVVLVVFSGWFFTVSIRLFYYAIGLIADNKIDAKDAILMMALTWVTGSVFGGSFGALLKTLNGAVSTPLPNPNYIPGTQVHTSTTETTHEEVIHPATPSSTVPVPATQAVRPAVVAPPPPPPPPKP